MLDDRLKTKLRDQACLQGHQVAVGSARVIPVAIGRHTFLFDRLKPLPAFKVAVLDNLFHDATRQRLCCEHEDLREQEYSGARA